MVVVNIEQKGDITLLGDAWCFGAAWFNGGRGAPASWVRDGRLQMKGDQFTSEKPWNQWPMLGGTLSLSHSLMMVVGGAGGAGGEERGRILMGATQLYL